MGLRRRIDRERRRRLLVLTDAVSFLRDQLLFGAQPSEVVIARGVEAGLSRRAVLAAAQNLRVRGHAAGETWALPASDPGAGATGQRHRGRL